MILPPLFSRLARRFSRRLFRSLRSSLVSESEVSEAPLALEARLRSDSWTNLSNRLWLRRFSARSSASRVFFCIQSAALFCEGRGLPLPPLLFCLPPIVRCSDVRGRMLVDDGAGG